jgi:multicomponent Na+:H+ antiporter subunit E
LKQHFVLNSVIQFFLLLGLWLLLSGHYDVIHISMGVFSALLVVLINLRLRKYYFYEEEISETGAKIRGIFPTPLRFGRVLLYIPWLILQIIVASLQVAAVVLNPKMPVDPALLRFKTRLPNLASKVILANSITLTPGTITVRLKDDEFLVHSLMAVSATGIIQDKLPEEVAKLYEKDPKRVVRDIKTIKSKTEI